MSFYSYKNKGNERSPGLADFEALHCITERVCIQVNKVYDSCLQQETLPDVSIPLTGLQGTAPYTFTAMRNAGSSGNIQNLIVTRLTDRPNFARVQADVIIPMQINYTDSLGTEYTTTGSITIRKDVVLYVPDDSIIPFTVEAVVGAISVSGTITGSDGTFTLVADVCVSVILKIVAMVELLVPSFGFCEIPPCEEYADETCDEFFSLPLFPPQMEDIICNNTALGSSFYNRNMRESNNSSK